MSVSNELQVILPFNENIPAFVQDHHQIINAILQTGYSNAVIRDLLQTHDFVLDLDFNRDGSRPIEMFASVKMLAKFEVERKDNTEASNEMRKFLLLNQICIKEAGTRRCHFLRFITPTRTPEERALSKTVGSLIARFDAIQREYKTLRAERSGFDKPYIAVPDRADLDKIIAGYEARRATGESFTYLDTRVLFQDPVEDCETAEKKIQELYNEECDVLLRLARLRLIHGPSIVDHSRLRAMLSW